MATLVSSVFSLLILFLVAWLFHFLLDQLALLHLSIALLLRLPACRILSIFVQEYRPNEWRHCSESYTSVWFVLSFLFSSCDIKKRELEYGHARINSPHTHNPIACTRTHCTLGHAFYFASLRFVSFCCVFPFISIWLPEFSFQYSPVLIETGSNASKTTNKRSSIWSVSNRWYWMLFYHKRMCTITQRLSCSRNSFIISDLFWNVNAYGGGGGDAQIIEGKKLIAEVIAWNVFEKNWQNRRMSLAKPNRVQALCTMVVCISNCFIHYFPIARFRLYPTHMESFS